MVPAEASEDETMRRQRRTKVIVASLSSVPMMGQEALTYFNDENISYEEKYDALFTRNRQGATPLFFAVKQGQSVDLIQRMLEIGGKELVMIGNKMGESALHTCAFCSSPFEIFEAIADVGGSDAISQGDKFGNTPLHYACYWEHNRDPRVIKHLAQICPSALKILNQNSQVPASENFETQALLEKIGGSEYEELAHQSYRKSRNLSLLELVRTNKIELALSILKEDKVRSQEVFEEGGWGLNPLMAAIWYCGHVSPLIQDSFVKLIQGMIDVGGKALVVKTNSANSNALHYAAFNKAPLSVIKILVETSGPDALKQPNNWGSVPLHDACATHAPPEIIQYLAYQGGSETFIATNKNGLTPLCVLFDASNPSDEHIMTLQDAWYECDPDCSTTMSNRTLSKTLTWANNIDPSLIASNKFLKTILNTTFILPKYRRIILIDIYVQIVILGVLSPACLGYVYQSGTEDETKQKVAAKSGMACLIVCVLLLIIREVMQLLSSPLIDYVLDSFNLIDDTQIIFILWTIEKLNDVGQGDVEMNSITFRRPMIAASCLAWVTLLLTIGRFNYGVSVFTSAFGQIILELLPLIFTTVFAILAFGVMFHIAKQNKESLTESLFNSMAMFLDINEVRDEDTLLSILTFIFALVIGILLLNILIAVISDVFREVTATSENAFWTTRLNFMIEVISINNTISSIKKKISQGLVRWGMSGIDANENISEDVVEATSRKRIAGRKSFAEYNDYWLHTECPKEDFEAFFKWWFYSWQYPVKPTLRTRLYYFYSYADVSEIVFPGGVFGNILLGLKYNEERKGIKAAACLGIQYLHFFVGLLAILITLILGACTIGAAWPEEMVAFLFFGPVESTKENRLQEKNKMLTSKAEHAEKKLFNLQKQNAEIVAVLMKMNLRKEENISASFFRNSATFS